MVAAVEGRSSSDITQVLTKDASRKAPLNKKNKPEFPCTQGWGGGEHSALPHNPQICIHGRPHAHYDRDAIPRLHPTKMREL